MKSGSLVPRVAAIAGALADPTRILILAQLARGERCVCDLTEELRAAQSRLSFHLKILKNAGLVTARPDGSRAAGWLSIRGPLRLRNDTTESCIISAARSALRSSELRRSGISREAAPFPLLPLSNWRGGRGVRSTRAPCIPRSARLGP